MDYPFKGDETPLRSMEHSELISIVTHNGESSLRQSAADFKRYSFAGRPSSIKPGKPVYKFVFERLVNGEVKVVLLYRTLLTIIPDPIFQATQDIAYNTKLIASADSTIKSCEQELLILKDVEAGTSGLWGSRSAVTQRVEYLLKNMRAAETKIETLEKQNAALKKILSKGG